jgi:hypothetical protein
MIDSAIVNLEVLEDSEVEDFDILLASSDHDIQDVINDGKEREGYPISKALYQ